MINIIGYLLFTELQSIAANIKGKAWDAPEAVPIGTVCMSVMGVIIGGLILLDTRKIFFDLVGLKNNVCSMIRHVQYSKMESTA